MTLAYRSGRTTVRITASTSAHRGIIGCKAQCRRDYRGNRSAIVQCYRSCKEFNPLRVFNGGSTGPAGAVLHGPECRPEWPALPPGANLTIDPSRPPPTTAQHPFCDWPSSSCLADVQSYPPRQAVAPPQPRLSNRSSPEARVRARWLARGQVRARPGSGPTPRGGSWKDCYVECLQEGCGPIGALEVCNYLVEVGVVDPPDAPAPTPSRIGSSRPGALLTRARARRAAPSARGCDGETCAKCGGTCTWVEDNGKSKMICYDWWTGTSKQTCHNRMRPGVRPRAVRQRNQVRRAARLLRAGRLERCNDACAHGCILGCQMKHCGTLGPAGCDTGGTKKAIHCAAKCITASDGPSGGGRPHASGLRVGTKVGRASDNCDFDCIANCGEICDDLYPDLASQVACLSGCIKAADQEGSSTPGRAARLRFPNRGPRFATTTREITQLVGRNTR